MALSAGARLGSYEVSGLIGVGGMGEVYRAIDTNLARQVAIEVLPEAMASDAGRLLLFERVSGSEAPTPIEVVVNWFEEPKRLLPRQ